MADINEQYSKNLNKYLNKRLEHVTEKARKKTQNLFS